MHNPFNYVKRKAAEIKDRMQAEGMVRKFDKSGQFDQLSREDMLDAVQKAQQFAKMVKEENLSGEEFVERSMAMATDLWVQRMAALIDKEAGPEIDMMLESMVRDNPEAQPYKKEIRRALLEEFARSMMTDEEPDLVRAIGRGLGIEANKKEGVVNRQPTTLRGMAQAIATDMNDLRQFAERKPEEVTELAKQIPFRILKDPRLFVPWARGQRLALRDAYSILAWSNSMRDFLKGVDPVGDVTYDEVQQAAELAQTQSIILQRVNYLLHEQMFIVYDLLENANRMRFMVKKHYLRAEDCYAKYERPRQRNTEVTAWSTLQDHLRLAADALQPRLQRVYEAARDRMIFLGLKDIELRSRIVVALTVGKVQHLSFNHFFDDFKRDCHCDLRRLYADDDLLPMTQAFADMVQALGIGVTTDKTGMPVLRDFDIDQSVRTGWAWQSFMRDLRDVDLMDETAKQAIDLNPKVQQDYYAVLHEEEERLRQQQQAEMADRLAERFKVTKL